MVLDAYNKMIRYSTNNMYILNFTEVTSKYLIEYGVPRNEILLIKFTDNLKWYNDKRKLVVIGVEDKISKLCIEVSSDEIYLVDEDETAKKFINSSISNFVECLNEYENIQKEREGITNSNGDLDERENAQLVNKFELNIFMIDPKLCEAEYFWPLIVEQMKCLML